MALTAALGRESCCADGARGAWRARSTAAKFSEHRVHWSFSPSASGACAVCLGLGALGAQIRSPQRRFRGPRIRALGEGVSTLPGVRKRSDLTKERLQWLQRSERQRQAATRAVKLRQVLVVSEEMAAEVQRQLVAEPETWQKLSELSLEEGELGWVGLHDSYLDEMLPLFVRHAALRAQPGDVLKLQSDRGWHVLRIEDVMLDLRVKRLEQDGGKAKDALHSKSYTVVTMGCQMNQADSERMEGQLASLGMRPVLEEDDPDVVLLNTCSIRDKAEKKVYARLDAHLQRKRKGQDVTLVVTGCVAQQEGEDLLRAVPEVDVVMGPQFANRLADVLNESVLGLPGHDNERNECGPQHYCHYCHYCALLDIRCPTQRLCCCMFKKL
eukprot:s3179_g2.t1